MRVTLRGARSDDFAALGIARLPWRMRALAAVDESGRVLGAGGLVFRPDGVWLSVAIADDGRRYKLALVRAAKRMLAIAKRDGIGVVYASAEPGRTGAAALLLRLGFRLEGNRFVWRAGDGVVVTQDRRRRL